MKEKLLKLQKKYFPVSLMDTLLTVGIFAVVILICFLLTRWVKNNHLFISILLIAAVFLVARYTKGYLYGIITAGLGTVAVRFVFSDLYRQLTQAGFPLATLSVVALAVLTSTLTIQMRHYTHMRREADREKIRGNLLRAISHDLRTPLTSILGAASAIIENDKVLSRESRLKLLSEVREDAQWLIRMVENLLTVTRIDGERNMKIIKTDEAVEEVVSEAVSKFKKRFPDHRLDVLVPQELLLIPMDAVLIEQVLINLLENAVTHGKGATLISLLVYVQGKNAVFEVADNGAGIPEQVLPYIFDGLYKQRSEAKYEAKNNMGIGLSVCATIIKAHNGYMMAENREGGGALFRFTIPLEVKRKK
ncbi:MAG: ATP-binding protein [Eubacteriales bacterium]